MKETNESFLATTVQTRARKLITCSPS